MSGPRRTALAVLSVLAIATAVAAVSVGGAGERPTGAGAHEVIRAYRMPDGAIAVISALQVPGAEGESLDDLVPDGEPLDPEVTAQFDIYRKWPSNLVPVTVFYNPEGEPAGIDAAPIVEWAGETWAATPGQTWRFIYGGQSEAVPPAPRCGGDAMRDGVNVVGWHGLAKGTLAYTCSLYVYNPDVPDCAGGYDCLDGEPMVIESDIVINNRPHNSEGDERAWSDEAVTPLGDYDLYSNLLHEMGHVAGLLHQSPSAVHGNPVMSPVLNPGIQKRVLQPDDIAGMLDLYAGVPPPPLEARAVVPMSVRE